MCDDDAFIEYADKCRVCLQRRDRDAMHSIFDKRDAFTPMETLTTLCGMHITRQDRGPSLICFACLLELDVTRKFLHKCQRAEQTLSSALSFIKVEVPWKPEDADYRSDIEELPADLPNKVVKAVKREKKAKPGKREPNGATSLKCDICGRDFKYAASLRSHQRTHAGERPFACDMCEKTFSKKDNLLVHIAAYGARQSHGATDDDAHGHSNLHGGLEYHAGRPDRKRHLNKRAYSCETCGAAHYTAYELRTHARTHTGEKPHACTVCGRRFTASNNLYIHRLTHTGERPHQCSVCGKKFISKNILSIHKRTHTGEKPYVCPVCGKRFASNKLAAHARTHTGEKRHVCTLCGRQFASPNVLKIHMRRHTGEKPYQCSVCGQHYAHTQSLNKHKRRRHAFHVTQHSQDNREMDGGELSAKSSYTKLGEEIRNTIADNSEDDGISSNLHLVTAGHSRNLIGIHTSVTTELTSLS